MTVLNTRANCEIYFVNKENAKTAIESLKPDNKVDPPMSIDMEQKEEKIIIEIKDCPTVGTLLTTLDDIFEHLLLNQDLVDLVSSKKEI